jgi:xanthine dehydrogenase accessory factor
MVKFHQELQEELNKGAPCVVVTVISTQGSTPRKKGAKMLIRADGTTAGTVGGGKFESLVLEAAEESLTTGELLTKSFPLHECDDESFGAICGGEIRVLLEPYAMKQRLLISGAGHCGQALATLAMECGWPVVMFDNRPEMFDIPFFRDSSGRIRCIAESDALNTFRLCNDDCVVLVSKGHPEDRAALRAILSRSPQPELAYLGMIGSQRKNKMVLQDMEEEGIPKDALKNVFAPIGLDIGSETPAEIAVSIMAEILQVTRGTNGGHMRK